MPDGPHTVPDGPLTAPEVVTLFTRQDGTFGGNEGVSIVTVSWQPAHLLYTPTTAGYDFIPCQQTISNLIVTLTAG